MNDTNRELFYVKLKQHIDLSQELSRKIRDTGNDQSDCNDQKLKAITDMDHLIREVSEELEQFLEKSHV